MDKLLSMTPSTWRAAKAGKENTNGDSPSLDRSDVFKDSPDVNAKPRLLAKSKSQPKVAAASKSEFCAFCLLVRY